MTAAASATAAGRRLSPTTVGTLIAILLIPWLLLALPVKACSCAGGLTLAQYAEGGQTAIFTGTLGLPEGRGTPIAVDRWFIGPGAGLVVWISNESFGNGADCGISKDSLPVAARMLFVAWQAEPGGDLRLSICQPYVGLETQDGQALLAEALVTFGGAGPAEPTPTPGAPSPAPETPATASPAAPSPSASPTPDLAASPVDLAVVAVVGTGAAGMLVLVGAALVSRRRRR